MATCWIVRWPAAISIGPFLFVVMPAPRMNLNDKGAEGYVRGVSSHRELSKLSPTSGRRGDEPMAKQPCRQGFTMNRIWKRRHGQNTRGKARRAREEAQDLSRRVHSPGSGRGLQGRVAQLGRDGAATSIFVGIMMLILSLLYLVLIFAVRRGDALAADHRLIFRGLSIKNDFAAKARRTTDLKEDQWLAGTSSTPIRVSRTR